MKKEVASSKKRIGLKEENEELKKKNKRLRTLAIDLHMQLLLYRNFGEKLNLED